MRFVPSHATRQLLFGRLVLGGSLVTLGLSASGCSDDADGVPRFGDPPTNVGQAPAEGEGSVPPSSSGDSTGGEQRPDSFQGSTQNLGDAVMGGSGQTSERYFNTDVTRNGRNYFLMANGWGPRFGSQTLSFDGTSFTVENMTGDIGDQYEPATYPTVFCGRYSNQRSRDCGLPAAIDSLSSLHTGWRWAPNGNAGEYNAAYDIWLANGDNFTGFLMVWLRDPPGQQPAGRWTGMTVEVANVPGRWNVWEGTVGGNNRPILNYVRAEGDDTLELEFDVLDFVRDAEARDLTVPGTHILSVAVGFEIWRGPVSNLDSLDFYVEPRQ